ncbi:hypothetical protein [Actinoplanes sp. URMC 104]|uniref:hypothetical protein n=1 Tax=Actinoplanes sp. URMC 104 TaxID=3423409 RepID=UPI003F1CA4F9
MALLLLTLNVLAALRPARPETDPAVLLGMSPHRTPRFSYGTPADTIAVGAVIYRGGDWRKVAAHTDLDAAVITVTDTYGHELAIPTADTMLVVAEVPMRVQVIA